MPVLLHILALVLAVASTVAPAVAEEPTPPSTQDEADRLGAGAMGNYARWVGRDKADLLEFWGQPHKVKRKGEGSVLIYELRVTCDGVISGTQYTRLGKGIVTGSQDPLDGIEHNVPQSANRRAGMRVAAQQTVKFFIDAKGDVSHHEATKPKTNWKRCKY